MNESKNEAFFFLQSIATCKIKSSSSTLQGRHFVELKTSIRSCTLIRNFLRFVIGKVITLFWSGQNKCNSVLLSLTIVIFLSKIFTFLVALKTYLNIVYVTTFIILFPINLTQYQKMIIGTRDLISFFRSYLVWYCYLNKPRSTGLNSRISLNFICLKWSEIGACIVRTLN